MLLGKRGNDKQQRCAAMKLKTSLNDIAAKLREHGRHSMRSYLSSLPIAVLRSLDTEANRFYDGNHQMHDAALLTRCYTQHALRSFIDSESNHIRHVIKSPIFNKGIDFIDLPLLIYQVYSRTNQCHSLYLRTSKTRNLLMKKKKNNQNYYF